MNTKVCTKCGIEYPATTEYFHKKSCGKYGLRADCKICNCKRAMMNYNKNREKRLKNMKEYREKNNDKISQYMKIYVKEYYKKNKSKILHANKKWKIDNQEQWARYMKEYRMSVKTLEYNKNYRDTHKEQTLKYAKKWRIKKYNNDIKFQLNVRLSNAIYTSIFGNKNGRHWETLVDYTLDQLISHLEKQFKPNMSWENYGLHGWHIDHIRPIASFNFNSPEDEEFKQCWALENLQPLWSEQNWKKSDKWEQII